MIFSRRRGGAGRHAKAETAPTATADERRAARRAALLGETDHAAQSGNSDSVAVPDDDNPGQDGPYDFDDAPQAMRLDLGSLLLPAIDGVEIRVQAGDNGVIQQVALVHGDNGLQLGVFAAPRSESLWEDVREDIRKSLFNDGVGAQDVDGHWGTELRARLRTENGFNDLRFVGIDGPRWMVRAVFHGPIAIDPDVASPLHECLTGLVVRRDDEARPVGEPLPLRLPDQIAQQAPQAAGPQQGQSGQSPLVPGRVPPPPAPFAAPAAQASSSSPLSGEPRRKPSPRPRRDP